MQKIGFLNTELAESAVLHTKKEEQQDEIKIISNRLTQKQQAAKGAKERKIKLKMEFENRGFKQAVQ